jgi:hypothetical protein
MKHSAIYYEALSMKKHGFTLQQALIALARPSKDLSN